MFSKFTSILQHAVDALAPQLSLQEEFVFHWKAVTNFFIDNKGEKLPIEQTSIPAHLEQMLVILQQEDGRCDRGMYGPCLEYLLQHKLLETLNSLGRTDINNTGVMAYCEEQYPPGMKQIVLSFFTKLLSRIKQPLLAHVSVYRAVQRLIKTCGEVKAGPSEIEEIQFLCTVCAKIKADPYLVNFFLEIPKSSSANKPGSHVPVVDEPTSENKLQQEFHLVNTLLILSHSEDSRVAVKACEGLILCSSLPDPIAAHCLVNSTQFCEDFTQRLIDTYQKLPKEVNPLDLENVQAKWGMDVITKREDETSFVGKRYLISFLSWLDYCDQLSTIANPIVAEALARTIHQKFLIAYFQPDLLQISESGCIASMAYMSRCLRTVCSQRLLSELVLFLLGDERKPELTGETKDSLRCRLVERCNSVSEEVCLITLQLFDTLLQKDDEHIHHNLVLRNLESRQYYDSKCKSRRSDVQHVTESDDKCKLEDNVTRENSRLVDNEIAQNPRLKDNETSENSRLEDNASSESSRLEDNASSESSRLEDNASSESSRLEDNVKSESSRLEDNASSESSRLEDNASSESSRLKDNETSENSRLEDNASSENSRLEDNETSKNSRLEDNEASENSKLEDNASSESSRLEDNEISESSRLEDHPTSESSRLEDNVKSENSRLEDNEASENSRLKNNATSESSRLEDNPTSENSRLEDNLASDKDPIPQIDNQPDHPKDSVPSSMYSPPGTPQHVKTEVHKIVNSFLTLLPEDLKSSYQTVDGGYDMYLKDAHKQYSAMVEACKPWGYPHDVPTSTDTDSAPFYEGSFLHMILDKFGHLLDQSYSINLQLTSVISKLALIPHPCLHEFLLDPVLPLKPGIRNLFSIFQKVSNEIKSQYASEPELFRKLVTVRKKLMGNATTMQSVREHTTGIFERLDDESRLEAIIVFEEFCKELSAIVFVKHHAAVTEEKK